MPRGMLNDKIQAVAQADFGRDITQRELRLMPYVQHVMLNNQRIDPNRVNEEEREILSEWRKTGWIEGGAGGMRITKDFWNTICEILFYGYVAPE